MVENSPATRALLPPTDNSPPKMWVSCHFLSCPNITIIVVKQAKYLNVHQNIKITRPKSHEKGTQDEDQRSACTPPIYGRCYNLVTVMHVHGFRQQHRPEFAIRPSGIYLFSESSRRKRFRLSDRLEERQVNGIVRFAFPLRPLSRLYLHVFQSSLCICRQSGFGNCFRLRNRA